MKSLIGVDIGATNLRVGLGNANGEFSKVMKNKTVNTGKEEDLLNQIKGSIEKLGTGEFKKVVIGAAGRIEGKKVFPSNLKYRKISFGSLSKEFGVNVEVYNDTSLAALGEKAFGVAKEYENFVYLTLSTGIGAGVYIDGSLLKGKQGNAGEVGHNILDYDSEFKSWEGCVSGRHLPEFLKEKYGKDLTCKQFFKEVEEGRHQKAFEEVIRINASGIANLVNSYDPKLIVIGGGLVLKREGKPPLRKIKQKLSELCINEVPEIKVTSLGDNVVLYGALTFLSREP